MQRWVGLGVIADHVARLLGSTGRATSQTLQIQGHPRPYIDDYRANLQHRIPKKSSRIARHKDAARTIFAREHTIKAKVYVTILGRHAFGMLWHDHCDRTRMKEFRTIGQRIHFIDNSAILVIAAGLRIPGVGASRGEANARAKRRERAES